VWQDGLSEDTSPPRNPFVHTCVPPFVHTCVPPFVHTCVLQLSSTRAAVPNVSHWDKLRQRHIIQQTYLFSSARTGQSSDNRTEATDGARSPMAPARTRNPTLLADMKHSTLGEAQASFNTGSFNLSLSGTPANSPGSPSDMTKSQLQEYVALLESEKTTLLEDNQSLIQSLKDTTSRDHHNSIADNPNNTDVPINLAANMLPNSVVQVRRTRCKRRIGRRATTRTSSAF